MRGWWWIGVALAMVLLIGSGCARSPEAPVDVQPSAASSTGPGNALCPEIDLRSPTGDRVDLNGEWEQRISDDQPPVRWWVRQIGSCVWAVTMSPEFPDEQIQGFDLQALRGEIDASFTIGAEIAEVAPMTQVEANVFPPMAEIVLLVEFDADGEAVLREDRRAGVEGPRCPDPAFHCLPPILLTRAD